MWKIKYLLPNQVNDDYLWKESDLRCLLDRGDSFLLLFLISTYTRTSFLFKRLPCTEKKGTLKAAVVDFTLPKTSLHLCLSCGRRAGLFPF